MFDDGRLKTADYHTSSGFGLRGVTGETTAFSHANEISAAAIDRAAATLKLLDPAKGRAAAAAGAHQPGDVRQRRPDRPGAVRRQGRAVPADRRRGARPRPARRPGQRDSGGELERDRHRPRRRLRRLRRAPAGPARRQHRGRAERPPRDRQPWARRALSLRPPVRPKRVGATRSTRRWRRRWSISNRSPRRRAKCRSCSARAGPACCSTKRSATASKAISTARAPRPSRAASASASRRPASR